MSVEMPSLWDLPPRCREGAPVPDGDYIGHPLRLDPVTGKRFVFDPTWRAFVCVRMLGPDGEPEDRMTPISVAMLVRSVRG